MKSKKFDAIKMSREIRKKLSKEFATDPENFLKKLSISFDTWDGFKNTEKKKSKSPTKKKERI